MRTKQDSKRYSHCSKDLGSSVFGDCCRSTGPGHVWASEVDGFAFCSGLSALELYYEKQPELKPLICIDQAKPDERNHQVWLVTKSFGLAKHVFFYIKL
ncbi:hypothetical protein B0H67DRAFT_642483 [Lasiosphaeris hirsuta]|uniref:Uncharacterized protein n=1 Tax=Lasiosphaeris hirsuta TaxID=260670 RepID=A0AA40B206_9PEZI|nr:hypothetical protein B0H67DRAFT_642483 [Lasiosphaeris hirsuta]